MSVLRRLGEGSSGVVGAAREEEAAALCINFIVKSREDIDFDVGALLLADDILTSVKLQTTTRDRVVGPALLLLVFLICSRALSARMLIVRRCF